MKTITLQAKFYIFSMLTTLSVFALAWEGYDSIRKLGSFFDISHTANIVTQNHMQGDMMHDAIRGDVLRGILAHKNQNQEEIKAALADLNAHSAEFSARISENMQLSLPETIHAPLTDIAPKLADYKKKAKTLLENLDSPGMERMHEDFTASFEALEKSQSDISDAIEAWSGRINEEGVTLAEESEELIVLTSIIAIILAIGLPVYSTFVLFRPLHRSIGAMLRLADGKLDADTSFSVRHDEIGRVGKSLEIFKANAVERNNLEQAQKQAEIKAQEEKKQMMEKLANDFDADVQGIITTVAQAAADMCRVAETMQKTVSRVGQQSESASTISQRAANNVANVSAAVEQMSASVKEIAAQASKSSDMVAETVGRTVQADKTTRALSDAVSQISGILQLIQDIAGQINLLALNATIESARAGEAGKGFAVVASEVKTLASQTTKATEEIAKQIENVQHASNEVVEVLKNIQEGIANVNQYSTGISAAVEEQSAATREISANMQHAALGVQDIGGNINGIAGSVSEADQAARDVLTAAKTMTNQSGLLKEQMAMFLRGIRG